MNPLGAKTIVCSDEAEKVLSREIDKNAVLENLFQRIEWVLSRQPCRGLKLEYEHYEYWLYELKPNRSDLPTIRAVYSIQTHKVTIEFLDLEYSNDEPR